MPRSYGIMALLIRKEKEMDLTKFEHEGELSREAGKIADYAFRQGFHPKPFNVLWDTCCDSDWVTDFNKASILVNDCVTDEAKELLEFLEKHWTKTADEPIKALAFCILLCKALKHVEMIRAYRIPAVKNPTPIEVAEMW
jgi:hypothetical protein